VEGTNKAIASTIDGEARYVYNNPYEGGKMVVAEAYRNLISVGAKPLAMTDCLNYGSPEKKDIYQQLADSTKGMAEACEALNTPVVSGNVSLYNETKGTSIFPTPVVGMVGLIEDVTYLNDYQPKVNDRVYVVGETKDDFGGSQVEKLLFKEVNHEPSSIDLSAEVKRGEQIKDAIRSGKISHTQAVGKGGLAIGLAKIATHFNLGLDVTLPVTNAQLFSETQGRYIVIVKEGQSIDIDDAVEIGRVTDNAQFTIKNDAAQIKYNVSDLNEQLKGAIAQCMKSRV